MNLLTRILGAIREALDLRELRGDLARVERDLETFTKRGAPPFVLDRLRERRDRLRVTLGWRNPK